MQYAEPENFLPILDDKQIKVIQVIVGVFIYYGIAINKTILVTLNDIAVEKSKATNKTSQQIAKLLNYIATQLLAVWYVTKYYEIVMVMIRKPYGEP